MKYDKPDHSLIKYILALLNIPSNADASCQQAAAALGHQRPYYIQMACSLIRFMDEMPGGFLIYQADDDEEIIYANTTGRCQDKVWKCSF